jgi:hypothetical protein
MTRYDKTTQIMRTIPISETTTAGGVSTGYARLNGLDAVSGGVGVEEWTDFGSLFDFYRVIAFRANWLPSNMYSTTNLQNFLVSCFDWDSTTNGTANSYATIGTYSTMERRVINRPFSRQSRVEKLSQASTASSVILQGGWLDIAAPVTNGIFAWYADGLTVATLYGRWIFEFVVAFKGRR